MVVWSGRDVRMKRWLIITSLLLVPLSVRAGVVQIIHPVSGAPIGWDVPDQVHAAFDRGGLGRLSPAQARALVEAMMDVWGSVPSSRVAFAAPSLLDVDVTADNFAQFVDGTICTDDFPAKSPSMQRGESPIIFDHDGAIIELLGGKGASRKIVGKSALRCFTGTIDNPKHATQAFAVFNGRFLDNDETVPDLDVNVYAGIMLHELGHFLGLHHSLINETVFYDLLVGKREAKESRVIPVMYPLVFRESLASTVLKPDDIAAISALYPTDGAAQSLATLSGAILDSGQQPFRGANVVARRQDDPVCQAVSAISGRSCTPLVDDLKRTTLLGDACLDGGVARGAWRIEGLAEGQYTVEVSELTSMNGERKNMFPKEGVVTLPGDAEFYNLHDAATEDALAQTVLVVDAGADVTGLDIVLSGALGSTPKKTMTPAPLTDVAQSACVTDPVNYAEYVDDIPLLAQSDTDNTAGVSATNPNGNVSGGETGAGCALMPSRRAGSDVPLAGGVVWLGLVAFGAMAVRRRTMVVCLLGGALVCAAGGAHASSIMPASPEELTEMAGQIFHGTCEQAAVKQDARGFQVTEVTYRVHRIIKGDPVDTVTFRVVGAEVNRFVSGAADVIFLYPASDWGYTSPVAGPYGQFRVYHTIEGAAVVRNPFAAPGASAEKSTGSAPAVISPDTLLDQISTLIKNQAP